MPEQTTSSDDLSENKKKLPLWLIILLLLAIAGGGYLLTMNQGNEANESNGKDTGANAQDAKGSLEGAFSAAEIYDLTANEAGLADEFKLYGRIIYLDTVYTSYFMLGNDYTSIDVWYKDMGTGTADSLPDLDISALSQGDHVLVTARLAPDGFSIWAKSINPTTAAEIEQYEKDKQPQLEIEILDYPQKVAHGCEPVTFSVRLKNTGKVTFSHSDAYYLGDGNYSKKYAFYFVANGVLDASYSTNDEGTEIASAGFEDFGTLQPGEEKIVEYGAGGLVTQVLDRELSELDGKPHPVGIAGEPNQLASSQNLGGKQGKNNVQIKLGQTSNDEGTASYADPVILASSQKIEITLQEYQCDMDDIDVTVYSDIYN